MKKHLLLLVMMLLPMVASADDSGSCGANVTYTYVESTHTLTISGTGSIASYGKSVYVSGGDYIVNDVPWYSYRSEIIEAIIEDGVTAIGNWAFYGCSGMTSITIPNSVTHIDPNAFHGCSGLTSITIPNSVMSISSEVFRGCSGLTSVTIPNSVIYIADCAFEGCNGLTSIKVEEENSKYDSRDNCNAIIEKNTDKLIAGCKNTTIPNGVTTIGTGAFYNCTGLISVTIPNSVTSIGYEAFANCTDLTSVTIPNSVTSIGNRAFYGCSGLTSVTIPNSVTSIGGYAFCYCSGLTSVTISNSVTSMRGTFKGCSGLTSVTIPNSVMSIGDETFSGCSGLTSVTIPNSVTSIEDDVFRDCSSLASVTIPNSVTSIGMSAFQDCSGLTSVTISNSLTSIGECAFRYCSNLISVTFPHSLTSIGAAAFSDCISLTSVTIPNSVTSIGNGAFANCTDLTSMTIPNSVTSIETSFFWGCTGLSSVTIPNSVTSIGGYAFYQCSSLTSVTIPNSVESIGNGAFLGCSGLSSVTIPNSVTSIESLAFNDCSSLTSVTVGMETPLSISSSTFSNRANAILYVPKGCKAAYEAANYWKEFKEIVEIGSAEVEVTDVSNIDNVIYIEPIEETKGSEVVVPILMKNTADIRGFQFDLYLPNGVTLAKTPKGKYVCSLSNGRLPEDDEHTLTLSEQEDGAIRFLCGSQYNETFTGNEGEIATMKLLIAEDMAEGNYPIVLKKVKLSETNISNYYLTETVQTSLTVISYIPGDISGDGEVDVTDYIGVANFIMGDTPEGFIEAAADVNKDKVVDVSDYIGVANIILYGNIYGPVANASRGEANIMSTASDNLIYIEPFKADANSQATVSLKMKNTADIRGFQFDLYLPEGIIMVKNGKNLLSDSRKPVGDQHTLTLSEQQDGAIRFLCGSMDDETFTGNDGEIATLTVSIAGDMAQGDYPILLKKMKLSESNINNCYETESRMATITINNNSATGIEQLTTGSGNEAYYNLQGQRVNTPAKGVFVKNGKKVMMK